MPRYPLILAASALTAASAGFGTDPPAAAQRTGVAVTSDGDTRSDFRSAAARRGAGATDADHAGIWKAAVPPEGTTRGEFDSHDPLGVAAGVRIKTDCSINWLDPDSGRRYCFSSATSLVVFLEAPGSYVARAVANWDRLRTGTTR